MRNTEKWDHVVGETHYWQRTTLPSLVNGSAPKMGHPRGLELVAHRGIETAIEPETALAQRWGSVGVRSCKTSILVWNLIPSGWRTMKQFSLGLAAPSARSASFSSVNTTGRAAQPLIKTADCF